MLALDAEVAEYSLLEHLNAHTIPDWASMELFARLINDPTLELPLQEDDWATAHPYVAEPLDLSRSDHLPPVLEPGQDSPFNSWNAAKQPKVARPVRLLWWT